MDKLGDIELFVNVVKTGGLAAAGRKMSLSPASVTLRMNRLEESYGVRLLPRTTRRVSLTDEGAVFLDHCQKILQEVSRAEESLSPRGDEISGKLRVTAATDIGKQYVAPALAEFRRIHPKITAHLFLVDHVVSLVEGQFDVGIRFGGLSDNRMIARKLVGNHRVLFASPDYASQHGLPNRPEELLKHRCLSLEREDRALSTWYFTNAGQSMSINVNPVLTSNEGAQIREWALQGEGVALKSYRDIKLDLEQGRLITFMGQYQPDFFPDRESNSADLYAVYPTKNFMPKRVIMFIDFLQEYLNR